MFIFLFLAMPYGSLMNVMTADTVWGTQKWNRWLLESTKYL